MKRIWLLLLVTICALETSAQWNPVGPFGGLIRSSVVINGNNLLIGTNSGIYSSTDGGQTFVPWSQGLPAGNVIDLREDGNSLFACIFEKGIYRSDDDGVTWTLVLPGRYLRQDGFGKSAIEKVGSYLMVRNYDDFDDTLFFTNDGGANWTRQAIGTSLFNNVYGFGNALFEYSNAGVLGPQAGLYRSEDLGQTWSFSGTGMPAGQYVGQMVNFSDTLYVLSKHIFRSLDGGASWTQVTTDTLLTVGGSFAYAPEWFIKVGNTVFAQNGGNFNVKVATWRPGQSGWQDSFSGLPTQGTTLTFYSLGSKVFLGRFEGILYETAGPGQPWTIASLQGINAIIHHGLFTDNREALATASPAVRVGGDGSGSFTPNNPTSINDQYILWDITKVGSNYLLSLEGAFGVVEMYQASSPAGSWAYSSIMDILPDARLLPKGDSLIVYGSLGGTPACFITDATGKNPVTFDVGLFGFSFDDGVYSMTEHNGDLYAVITGFINNFSKLRKYDLPSGTFWEQVIEKIDGQFFGATAIASFQGKLYLGMINGGMKVSEDDGLTWSDVSDGLNQVVVNEMTVADSFLLAATDRGVFRLKSGESTWVDLTFDLPVGDVAKVAVTRDYLWALVKEGGVWRVIREGNVGIEKESLPLPFVLFPNPATQQVDIQADGELGSDVRWQILDLSGKLLLSGDMTPGPAATSIDVHALPAGMYFCTLSGEGKVSTQKFRKM